MSVFSDLRQSVRVFGRNPAFAILTVVMLALGIGSCTAIFTVVNSVLLQPLPYPDPGQLVQLQEISLQGTPMRVPEANFVDWRKGSHSFDGMAMFSGFTEVVRAGRQTLPVFMTVVSQDFFGILRTRPVIGSGLLPENFRESASPAAVISYGLWKRAFGGSTDLAGMQIQLEGRNYPVVGVMPPQFNFPAGGELWVPRGDLFGAFNPSRSAHNWTVLARLRPGVSITAASQEMATIAKGIHDSYADVTAVSASAVPLQQHMTESVRIALPVLLAAVGSLLLIACANTMNLTLTHIASREREFAVRTALGAGPGVLVRLFLSQSLLLAAISGMLGIALSIAGVPALLALGSGNLPRLDEIHTDWRVLAFALTISLLAGVVLGLVPALRLRNANLDETLKQGGRSQSTGAAAKRIRGGLVVMQVAMTIVLLVGAALLGRSFVNLLQVNLGFETENRIDIQTIFLTAPGDAAAKDALLKTQKILDRLRGIPGVMVAAAVRGLPLSAYNRNGRFTFADGSNSGDYWPVYNSATPGYFEAVGIPLIRGRILNAGDGANAPQVAVISEAVANHVWPGQDPIGRRINFANMDGDFQHFMTIVGIVGDVRNGPAEPVQGTVYSSFLQRGSSSDFDIVIRGTGDPEALSRTLSTQIRQIDPEASVRIKTFAQLFSSNLADRRFNLALLGVFGSTALILALMGIYAVASYSVAQRTQEIGIRMALGANARAVSSLFLSEGTRLVLAGTAAGVIGALGVSRVLESFLFNIRPTDALAYLLAIAPMILTALIANLLPARRAARVNPAITIQQR